jgi:osmoprotectant transport system ATP-binding protein
VPDTSDLTRGVSIELEHLSKIYPGVAAPAVHDVSMTIPAGEMVVLVGPSGCGKTTTMKMVNRLIEPSSGVIRLGGEDVTGSDPVLLRRRIGYVIQSIGLFPHMTIAENVGQVPIMLGWPKAKIDARVGEMLELVGLEPGRFARRYPRQLSGGQQQRVGVARALAADPPVLLMDEPFGATDPITREHLQIEFRGLQQRLGKTVIFVTHDFEEALLLGDRVAVLADQSRIVQYDTPRLLVGSPADEHVSRFIGSSAHVRMLGLLTAREAATQGLVGAQQIPADVTLRGALDTLMSGVPSLTVVDADGRALGGLDFASLSRTVGSYFRAPAGSVGSDGRAAEVAP